MDAGQTFTLDDLDPIPNQRIRRSAEEKLTLLADYEQAASRLRGKAWLREHGINPGRVSGWRRLRETAEIPVDSEADFSPTLSNTDPRATPRPASGPVAVPGTIEVDTGQTFTLDDLQPVPKRRTGRSDREKLALLASYEQAASQQRGNDWLRETRIHSGRISDWRRMRETAGLPVGDPRLDGVASSSLSLRHKAGLIREYYDAVSQRQGQQWLTAKNLTAMRLARWRALILSTQQQTAQPTTPPPAAPQQAIPHAQAGPLEILVDPAADSGLMLSTTAHDAAPQSNPSPGAVAAPRPNEPREAPGVVVVTHRTRRPQIPDLTGFWNPGPSHRVTVLDDTMLDDTMLDDTLSRQITDQRATVTPDLTPSPVTVPKPIEMDAGRTLTLDDLDPSHARPIGRSDEEKLALLASYEAAVAQRRGKAWLCETGVHRGRISTWRRLRETTAIPAGDPRLTDVAYSSLSLHHKAALIREYHDAVSQGQGPQWLAARNLTAIRLARWQTSVRSTQRAASGEQGGPSEIFVDPAMDFAPLLASTGHDTTSGPATSSATGPATGPGSVPGPIELDARQTFTLDELDPAPNQQIRRNAEEKMALLADYEQAASELRGRAWLREHGIHPARMSDWRRLRETAEPPTDDLQPATAAPSRLPLQHGSGLTQPGAIEVDEGQTFTLDDLDPVRAGPTRRSDEEKLALLADYERAAAQLRGQAWLREHGIHRRRISAWRRLRETAALPAGHPRLAGVAYSSLSLQQKAGLIREYSDALSLDQGQQWLTARNLTRNRISSWQLLIRSAQRAESAEHGGPSEILVDPVADFGQLLAPTGHGAPSGAAPSPITVPDPVEADTGQTFTLDDPDPTTSRRTRRSDRIRRSDDEKLALLADYERAAAQLRGKAWLRERGINAGRITEWRRETAELSAGGHRLAAAAYPPLSFQQKVDLVREYQEAVSQGQQRQWLTARKLTQNQLTRWQTLIRATHQRAAQPVAPQQAIPGDHGGPPEIFIDPALDFARLLSPTAARTASGRAPSPVPGSVPVPGPIEVDAEQTFTLDDLDPMSNRYLRRSEEEKLALLADYEQAASQRRGRAWLRERGFSASHISDWRRLREKDTLPIGDPRLAAARYSSVSLRHKAGMVLEYRDAVSQGQAGQWLAAKNLTRRQINCWQTKVLAASDTDTTAAGRQTESQAGVEPVAHQHATHEHVVVACSGSTAGPRPGPVVAPGLPGPIEVDTGQTFTLDDLAPARAEPIRRSDQEKFLLLADYEQATSQRKGQAWLREHGINAGRTREWRRLRETAKLAVGDPRLAAMAYSSLSRQQKAELVREYSDALSQNQGQQWLTTKNLTRNQISRWQTLTRSTQHDAAQPGTSQQHDAAQPGTSPQQGVSGDHTGPSIIFVDPAVDFGQLLSPANHNTTLSPFPSPVASLVSGPVADGAAVPGLIEVDAGQTSALTGLNPARTGTSRRSDEQKLALLADYEQAAAQQKGRSWLQKHGIHAGRTREWRRLRETAKLAVDDPRLAAMAYSSLSRQQKAELVREYSDALSQNQGQQWLTTKNLTRNQISRWQTLIRGHAADPATGGPAAGDTW